MASGLRERKKRQTRDAIVREAMRLFAERGFDGVTIADIAEAAEIAPRTYFGYFPTKEDVVFHEHDEMLAGLETAIAARAEGETTLDAMRAWLAAVLVDHDPANELDRMRKQLVHESPALEVRSAANISEFERALRRGVATDLGDAPEDLRPRIVAAAATAALMALDEVGEELIAEREPMDIIDETLAFLEGGMGALRAK
jgi:AcrR family transcriptional regulator